MKLNLRNIFYLISYFEDYGITGNGVTRKAAKNIVASSSYRPHRRASCQCSEPFRPWPLGSGYRGGQARKGMPRHAGVPEAPVLACWKSHEQDRRCRQPPHHPWERGTNENTNGLLREFFPKGKDITDTPEDYIQRKYHELNLRPRKCLGYKTPYEVYFSKVLHLA